MVTAISNVMTTNGWDAATSGRNKDLSLKIEAEAMAEFDRLKELVDEIRQANNNGNLGCEEYVKMVSGEP